MRMVAENIRTVAVMQSISALGFGDMVSWVNKMGLIPSHAEHEKRTRQKMVKRMQMDAERPDLIEGLVRKQAELVTYLFSLSSRFLYVN